MAKRKATALVFSANAGKKPKPAKALEPLCLFAHGAGKPSSSQWMQDWANRLQLHANVVTFDYPYIARRGAPPRAEKLVEFHTEQLKVSKSNSGDVPAILAGKSMGSRVCCHVAASAPHLCNAIICFGYPLVGGNGKMRDQVLLELSTPVLFIQGTRDKMCPLPQLEKVRAKMSAPSAVHVVDTGNHSLQITKTHTKKTGVTQDMSNALILESILSFLSEHGCLPCEEATTAAALAGSAAPAVVGGEDGEPADTNGSGAENKEV